ncbi:hypothetical protein PROFUN_16772 [Planoprotostelium fungivorum]|uniref:Uncharacterized protein n=1 Tax=Planoprotostelium fungivorum TaxID=1890364 RepID=A0A2P6MPJ3_9EUKA|nr:hypothetical protein PROFUN_16772 [Planoprotostelium fungivorum]
MAECVRCQKDARDRQVKEEEGEDTSKESLTFHSTTTDLIRISRWNDGPTYLKLSLFSSFSGGEPKNEQPYPLVNIPSVGCTDEVSIYQQLTTSIAGLDADFHAVTHRGRMGGKIIPYYDPVFGLIGWTTMR